MARPMLSRHGGPRGHAEDTAGGAGVLPGRRSSPDHGQPASYDPQRFGQGDLGEAAGRSRSRQDSSDRIRSPRLTLTLAGVLQAVNPVSGVGGEQQVAVW